MPTNPTKCSTCDGIGMVAVYRYEPMYRANVREMAKCVACNGTRVAKPVGRVRAFLARVGVRA